jgi:endonuclease/exonuclease/phosphatase family metal-dependent hydrolase
VKNSYIWNAPASKGVVCIKVNKGLDFYNILNVHLDSFKDDLRKKQMDSMKHWIKKKNISKKEAIIICGDYNIDYYKKDILIYLRL